MKEALLRLHRWLLEGPPHLAEEEVDVYSLTNYTMVVGVLAHIVFLFVFWALGIGFMTLYNLVSIASWFYGLRLAKQGHLNPAVFMASTEVPLHAWLATLFVGWMSGFHFYIMLAVVEVFAFARIRLTLRIAISVLQVLGYMALDLYAGYRTPVVALSLPTMQGLAVMNIVFVLVIPAGMVGYYSYVVTTTRRQLKEQNQRLESALNQLRTAQDQIVVQQKLAHLGTLTAGIAHEIKNPLNFVNNFSLLSLEAMGDLKKAVQANDAEEIKDILEILELNASKVHEHGARADRVVQSMLLHAGQSSGDIEETDLNALVMQSVELARSGAHGNVKMSVDVSADLDKSLPRVPVAPRDVARALLNIIGNAVHAAADRSQEDGSKPQVKVTTGRQDGMAIIRIRDNGKGITPEVRQQMFTPFFTTRPTGEGTGLGLSISNDIIVTQHKGRLSVDSVPGEYAEFTIELPV